MLEYHRLENPRFNHLTCQNPTNTSGPSDKTPYSPMGLAMPHPEFAERWPLWSRGENFCVLIGTPGEIRSGGPPPPDQVADGRPVEATYSIQLSYWRVEM